MCGGEDSDDADDPDMPPLVLWSSFEPDHSDDGAEIGEPRRQRFSSEPIDSELTTEDVAGAYYYGEGQASYYGEDDILADDQTTEDDEKSSEVRGTPRQI